MSSLLRPRPNLPMRPSGDKEIEVFDLDDLFEQYVETNQSRHFTDETVEPSGSGNSTHLFDMPVSNDCDPLEASPIPDWDATEDAWRKALQNIEQNPASPSIPSNASSVYPESRGKASLSDPHLFDIDDLFDLDEVVPRLSLSTPSTPPPRNSRSARKAVSSLGRSSRKGVAKSSTKSTFFSKMMRPTQYRMQDIWTRKMEGSGDSFNLQLPHNPLTTSPPPSSTLMKEENSTSFFPRDQPYTISFSEADTTRDLSASNYQLTPLSSPSVDPNSRSGNENPFGFSNDHMATAFVSHHMNNAALSALQTPPNSHRLSMAAWGSDTPASLDFSAFSASPHYSSPSTGKSQAWWGNGTAVTAPQPGVTPYQTTSSRSSSQNLGFTTAGVAGLGISCDTTSFSSFSDLETGRQSSDGHANGFPGSASTFDINYTPMYHQPSSATIPISHSSPMPSRSPSISPSMPSTRFARRRQSSNISNSRHLTQARRKSSTSTVSGPGHGNGHSRSHSGAVGFVNFTPDDSRKILTGVAPSGSSKTKARREKEAAERRRKLSQAAVKAVIEAGGDLGRLEKAGLLCLESGV